MICELCKKETRDLSILFDKKACVECIKDYERGIDESDLYSIIERQGKSWVKTKIDELVSIKTIKL